MNTTTIRRLTAATALTLGLAAAPLPALAGSDASPTAPPPPPRGAGGFKANLPDLTVELDDASEADGLIEGRVRLQAPLTTDLSTTVQVLFPGASPWDLACPEPGPWGGCSWTMGIDIPAGATVVPFDIGIDDSGDGDEPAELLRVEISNVWPANKVDVGPAADAWIFDGDGLDLSIPDELEVAEGDPGDGHRLDVVVTADQAVPVDVSVRVHTAIVGGSAVPPADYAAVDVIAVIPAGATSTTVEVPIVGDQVAEPDELLLVDAGDPSLGGMAFDGTTMVGRILDDDTVAPGQGFQAPGGGFRTR